MKRFQKVTKCNTDKPRPKNDKGERHGYWDVIIGTTVTYNNGEPSLNELKLRGTYNNGEEVGYWIKENQTDEIIYSTLYKYYIR